MRITAQLTAEYEWDIELDPEEQVDLDPMELLEARYANGELGNLVDHTFNFVNVIEEDEPPFCFCGHTAFSHMLDGCRGCMDDPDDDGAEPKHVFQAVS